MERKRIIRVDEKVQLGGMVLASIAGMILSLVFYALDKLNLTNDK